MKYEFAIRLPVAHEDTRGRIINIFQGRLEHVALITRARGSIFGNHYHPPGNTQRMYLISGSYWSVSAPVDDLGHFVDQPGTLVIEAGMLTEVGPMVGHAYGAIEDCVFLNLNTSARETEDYAAHTRPLSVPLVRPCGNCAALEAAPALAFDIVRVAQRVTYRCYVCGTCS